MRVRYTAQAQIDIDDIYNYIALDNPAAARRVEDYIRFAIEMLATFPRLGVATDEEDVRRMPIGRFPYTVFYRVEDQKLEVHVLRVTNAARERDPNRIP
jgi:toxin ParE1/3/4